MSARNAVDDLRYTKTEISLKNSMIKLLAEKPVKKISIVELCRNAEVNKSTFYLHYRDIYDYYDHLIETVANEIAFIFAKYSYEELVSDFKSIFIEVLNLIKRNELIRVMLLRNNGEEILPRITATINKSVITSSSGAIKNPRSFEIKNYFITCGTMSVIQRYSDEIFNSPQLADMLAHQIQNGFSQK